MASAGLLHMQVDVDINAVEDKIRSSEYQPDANDQPRLLQTMKTMTSPISEVWPEPPPNSHLHIFIRLPDVAGECFFFS